MINILQMKVLKSEVATFLNRFATNMTSLGQLEAIMFYCAKSIIFVLRRGALEPMTRLDRKSDSFSRSVVFHFRR